MCVLCFSKNEAPTRVEKKKNYNDNRGILHMYVLVKKKN